MKLDFKFSSLCGTVYKRGNLTFTPDGNTLLSPVGNQVSMYDLVHNTSLTLPFETKKDIVRLCLSPSGSLLIAVDLDGRAILVNYERRVLLHHFHFKEKVYDIQFSPNNQFIAVTHGKHVQVWHAPGTTREFAPFVLYKEYPGHYDAVISITWSSDSKYFLTSSKDMTARLYALQSNTFPGACLTGHNDALIGAWFSHDGKKVFTVSKDGAAYEWTLQGGEWSDDVEATQLPRKRTKGDGKEKPSVMKWKATNKNFFLQNHAKVVSATFHPETGLLSVGFDSGIFGIWELPDFTNIQTLRYSFVFLC
jgi:periodic tryptophan protein 2